ncbi:alpha/beta fold hydrolase [Pseudomaricurvus sp. HS19]|uniref:alpha/beta fold hydrolase n=1 Tax=Pseudomaricurvus sp. HS19 TaxID=2692626 RepID=UPI00136FE041|nr:alpha/beta hydrolase [Pseudomaricurvus sp. HS19]MYM63673.1 alpha/beta fold hydrolase [Pseudomaricurvus sp. HS19]
MTESTPTYFIPGTMCDQRLWQYLWPLLPQVKPVHLPIPDAPNLEAIVTELARQLPDGPNRVVGFSMGGYMAAKLACRHPNKVSALTVIANSPCPLPEAEVQQRQSLLQSLGQYGYRGISQIKVRQMLASNNHGNSALQQIIRDMDASLGEAVLIQQLSATTNRLDLAPLLRQLQLPVHFVVGDQDPLVNLPWLQALVSELPAGQLTLLPDTGHMVPLESPAALADLLSR